MKKKHRALWLVVLLLFSMSFATAIWADEPTDATQTEQQPAEKTMAEKAEEAKPKTFDTGMDPLWNILKVEYDDDIIVGQEFTLKVTAQNIGSGVAFYPIIQFTEEDDRKELSHFGVIGHNDNVYKSNIERVESGETKIFRIPMKVSPDTKELPEGSSYKINLTLKCNNWNVSLEPAFGVTASFEVKPSYTLSDPTFVVSSVTFSPEVTAGVTETVASITIDNIADSKARNVSVSLDGHQISEKNTDKNIRITDLSNTKRVGDISGKKSFVVSYGIELDNARKDNEMKMTINYNGLEKAIEETINMPLPLRENTSGVEPKVIINKYVLEPSKILAGNNVNLTLYIENTNSEAVNNISIKLTVPTSESNSATGTTVSGGTVFSPVNSSNTFFIENIPGKSIVTKDISLYVDPNAQAKTYVVPVSIDYETIDGEAKSSEDNINIPVTQESQVEIINSQIPQFGNAGMPIDFSVEFVNTGKVALTNFKATLESDDIPDADSNVYYIGNFDAAASDTFSGSFFPEAEGTVSGNIVLSYRDADNQEVRLEQPFTVEIGPPIEMPTFDPSMMEEPPQESVLSKAKAHAGTIVLVAIIIVLLGIIIRDKRRAKRDEELMNG